MKITVFHEPVELDAIPQVKKFTSESIAVIEDATISLSYSDKLKEIEGSVWKLVSVDIQLGIFKFELVK